VLPEHDVVVVDEAHELVDRVTGVATAELTAGMIGAAARRLGKLVDQAIADRLAEAGEGLAMVLEDLPSGRWDTLPQAAAGALSAVRDAAASCRQSLGSERREDPEAATGRKIAQASLDEVADTAVRLLAAFEEPDPAKRRDVVWLAEQGPDGARHKVLHAAPLWVGGLLRERLFGRATVVLTSATLALGGNFDALARQWGLPPTAAAAGGPDDPVPDPDAPKWSGMDVGSPFAHGRSGILYVAKRLPPPGRDGLPPSYLDEIAGLVEAAGGRTLGLFSSMRAAKQATEAMRGRLDTPLLCQGEDSTMQLVKKFAEDEATSLFGTLSLWQGVDVPGPSLSCVIIDRIPFPRPDDPLVAARQRATDARGGNGFLTVSATHAALLLAQGAGRLLRGMDDRGVVAILDPRLATARYGGFLRASLPPFWPTDDREKVHAALRRLRGA
jgi:ATP-dependent DNA helicase DinG